MVVSSQTLISNGCGASVGLEAGYTQIGSGVASLLGRFLNLRRNDLRLIVGCGAAGAIAAAFGAPITGAFYACELIVGVYSVVSAAPILAASLSAALTAQWLGGAPYSLEVQRVSGVGVEQYLALIVLALIATGVVILVMRSSACVERLFTQSWFLRSASDVGWLRNVMVERMMRSDVAKVQSTTTIAASRHEFPLSSLQAIAVVNDADEYCGLVLLPEMYSGDLDTIANDIQVVELARYLNSVLLPDMNVKTAMAVFDKTEAELLAVVESAEGAR